MEAFPGIYSKVSVMQNEGIRDFLESEIRARILSKAEPNPINKNAPHWKGYIYVDGQLVTKVKIPNNHARVMKEKKSQYIARDLKLGFQEFNRFVDCSMKGHEYYHLLRSRELG